MSPQRIQRQRTKGWRMPKNAVYVGRPAVWGNPFRVGDFYASRTWACDRPDPRGGRGVASTYHRDSMTLGPWTETVAKVRTRELAVALFRAYIAYEDIDWAPARIQGALGGRDLACWCPLGEPCHADVLLHIANGCPTAGDCPVCGVTS